MHLNNARGGRLSEREQGSDGFGEAEDDATDIGYIALHHAFCYLSYKMSEFQRCLDEVERRPETEP